MMFGNVADHIHDLLFRCKQNETFEVHNDHLDRFDQKQTCHDNRNDRVNIGGEPCVIGPVKCHLDEKGNRYTETGDHIQLPDVDFRFDRK